MYQNEPLAGALSLVSDLLEQSAPTLGQDGLVQARLLRHVHAGVLGVALSGPGEVVYL